MEQTKRDIESETRRAIQEIRREVADLTVAATEKVTRKTLNEDDPAPPGRGRALRAGLQLSDLREPLAAWRRSPRSMPARCSRSPIEHDSLDEIHEQLGALREPR